MAALFITERGYRFQVNQGYLVYRGSSNGPLGKAEHIQLVEACFEGYKKQKMIVNTRIKDEKRDNQLAVGFSNAIDALVISLNPEYTYRQAA